MVYTNFEKDLTVAFETIFKRAPKLERCERDDREGNPVTAIVVDGELAVYPTPGKRPSLSGFVSVPFVAVDRIYPWNGDPEQGNDDTELTVVPSESEAVVFVVTEMARELASQVVAGEGTARALGEGSSDPAAE